MVLLRTHAGSGGVPLHVQIRHVVDPFWDESPSNTEKAVRAMPLLGHSTLTLEEVQTAAANGTPITLVIAGTARVPLGCTSVCGAPIRGFL